MLTMIDEFTQPRLAVVVARNLNPPTRSTASPSCSSRLQRLPFSILGAGRRVPRRTKSSALHRAWKKVAKKGRQPKAFSFCQVIPAILGALPAG